MKRIQIRLDDPRALAAAAARAPKGFAFIEQRQNCIESVGKKRGTAATGLPAKEILVLTGHYQYVTKHGVRFCRDGCMVFAPAGLDGKPLRHRLVYCRKTGETTPAVKDVRGACTSCSASPVIAQTGKCPMCEWGEDGWF